MSPSKEYLVSAIVPAYKAERFMRGLIEDLEAQTVADQTEIVIVDTGSPTGEQAISREFQQRYDNIVYIRTEHRESSHAAINRGIKAAQGKYLTLACTDDRHKKDAYERMMAVMESRPDVALVYGNCYITRKENETFENNTHTGIYKWADFNPFLLLFGCFMGPQPMWRRNVHEKYGYFDESLESAGDWDFWLRLAEGETFLHINEFLGLYLYSMTSSEHRDPELSRREANLIQQRYLPRVSRLLGVQNKIMHDQPALSGALVLVQRSDGRGGQLERCLKQFQNSSPASGTPTVRVVRCQLDTPENALDVKVSPSTPTTIEALKEGVDWEAAYVMLLAPNVVINSAMIAKLISVAESDPSIAAVGPATDAGPILQKVREDTGTPAMSFEKSTAAWEEIPSLGGFCLLLKSRAVLEVGGVNPNLSFEEGLQDIYCRLKVKGLKLVFCPEVYVQHIQSPEEAPRGYDDIADGERLFSLGEVEGAKKIFEKIVCFGPNRIDALNNLGVIAFQQGAIDDAVSYFSRALEIKPDHFESIENMGNCMVAKRAYSEAIDCFNKALEVRPDEIGLLNSLANCFVQVEEFIKAEEVYGKSYQLDGHQENIGVILQELGNLKKVKAGGMPSYGG